MDKDTYQTPSAKLEEDIEKPNIRNAYWTGALIGPLAVIPAMMILPMVTGIYNGEINYSKNSSGGMFFIGVIGSIFAYVICFTYGSAALFFLRKIYALSLYSLLFSAALPAIICMGVWEDLEISLLIAYFSIPVCLLCWFSGFHKLKNG